MWICNRAATLVPAFYTLDFWIGSHNTETYDWIRQAVTVEIADSPNPQRSFPTIRRTDPSFQPRRSAFAWSRQHAR